MSVSTRISTVATLLLCLATPLLTRAQSAEPLIGRRLEDALRILQQRGLRLVFSSELVTTAMRVRSEPRAATPKEQLAQLLAPHGLVGETGPGGVIKVLRARPGLAPPDRGRTPQRAPPPRATRAASDRQDMTGSETAYREALTVTAETHGAGDANLGTARTLGADQLRAHDSHVADDPLRVVQALPGVAGGDDFRSDFSVRGSPYRHAGLVVDGVVAPWLQHASPGRGDTGTISMVPGGMVEETTLLVGAYPRRESGQLGPQINLALREGSRAARRFQVAVSGITISAAGEGPVGQSKRGSWLLGARRSHMEWPIGVQDEQGTVFGYSDLQSKLVYNVRAGQQVSFSLVAGQSNVERENSNPLAVSDGVNRAALGSLTWRSVVGSATVITQRVSSITHAFQNADQAGRPIGGGANGAIGYGLDVSRPVFGGIVEAGGLVRRVRGAREGLRGAWSGAPTGPATSGQAVWLERSGHASFRRAAGAGITLAAGLRLAASTLVQQRALDRWVQAEWAAGPRWRVHGSAGVVHQFAGRDQVDGWTGGSRLRPERATYVDLGVGQRVSGSLRWDVTTYARQEREILRDPNPHLRLVDGLLLGASGAERVENALRGSSRGVELTFERRSTSGVSGWVGYSYGVSRYLDMEQGETFAADFDQRHALNVSATATLPRAIRVGATFRTGTNFPIPGYLTLRDTRLYAGDARNQVRLPTYARLDLRAERPFVRGGRRFTLYAEILNVLNRRHLGLADGIVHESGEAVGFTERLFPRLGTAGLRFEF